MFIASCLLYASTSQHGYSWEDSGIFQHRADKLDLVGDLGLALSHPLYITLGWLLKFVPGLTLPWKLNIFSGIGMAGALASFAAVANLLTRRPMAALACTAMLAVAHTTWFMATMADVMAWQLAVFVAEIWILVLLVRRPTWQRLVALALASGIELSFHNLALLPLPIYFGLAIWLIAKRRLPAWSLAAAAGGWLIGASPYLVVIFQQIAGPEGLSVGHALRSALVGESCGPAVLSTSLNLSSIRKANYAFMFLSIAGPQLPLAILGAAVMARAVGRPLAIALAAIAAIHLAFVLRYDVPDQFTFFLPSLAMIALSAAVGLGWLMDRRKALGGVALTLAALWVAAMPVFYWQAPALVHRYHGGYSRARPLPFRDELRFWLTPWKQDEDSAVRYAQTVMDYLERQDRPALVISDDTPMYPLLQEIGRRRNNSVLVLNVGSPVLVDRLKDPSAFLRQEHSLGFDVYSVSNVPGYTPKELLPYVDPSPVGLLYRVAPPQPATRP